MPRHAQSGVALIITLILLAVVTFMALTFLAVSRRERTAVTTTTDTATARLAGDDALASAEAQIMANTLAAANPYSFGLVVSTNYINPLGFTPNSASPTNVNYDYYINGPGPLSLNDFLQNLANLYYLPRAPVYATNYTYQTNELQFYLDLNRNGEDDANGWVPEIAANGDFIHPDGTENTVNANVETNFHVGDPEWIGVLQHPDQPYGPNNPFVARYAFIALPIGNTLDLNAIYNQVFDENNTDPTVNPAGDLPANIGKDFFFRNQGVGSWEINLAAFLADLNTNQWGQVIGTPVYYYYQYLNDENEGVAFSDALSLLSYRYGNNYSSLASADRLLANAANVFPYDGIDGYSDGPLQTGFQLPGDVTAPLNDNPSLSWAGADNTNQFFDMQELFNPGESSVAFTNRLALANNGPSTYDRYTYYRLLSQMGVDSLPEQNQINLNYANAQAFFDPYGVVTNIAYYPDAETNLTPWTPLQFFTIAADRMLRTYSQEWLEESPSNYVATYSMTTNISTAANPFLNPTNMPVPFGISDIPVYVNGTNCYTPAVQRVLQLAANIYDATTNRFGVNGNNRDYPSVFRPIFWVTNDAFGYTNVYIRGYEPVRALVNGVWEIGAIDGNSDPQLNLPVDVGTLLNPSSGFGPGLWTNVNVYGVPWIIGAKKGFPNFNEFAMESVFQLTRKLQVWRPNTNDFNYNDYQYNQMFNLSLSNQFGVECWNSYTNDFLDSVAIYVTCTNSSVLANDEGFSTRLGSLISGYLPIDSTSNNNNGWPGYNPNVNSTAVFYSPASFQVPLNTNVAIITNSMYRFNVGTSYEEPGYSGPYLTTNLNLPYEQNVTINGNAYPQPHWWLATTNNVRVIILDTSISPNRIIDYVQLQGPNSTNDLTSEIISHDTNDMWNTNIQNGIPIGPIGIIQQIGVSLASYPPPSDWKNYYDDPTLVQNEIDGFRAFFGGGAKFNNAGAQEAMAEARMTNAIQTPYTPTAIIVQDIDWQANDPLVHYLASDLQGAPENGVYQQSNWPLNIGAPAPNDRYMPWGLPTATGAMSAYRYDLAIKDPLVWQSDDWDFPTYRMPTVGWLGRVHRGTPWQTVYLKSPNILAQTNAAGTVIGPSTWAQWTGDTLAVTNQNSTSYFDAENTAPVQDRLLFDLFTTAPDANATRGQLSVNVDASNPSPQAGLAAWSALFSGVEVLSNSAPDSAIQTNVVIQNPGSIAYSPFPVNPAGPAGANSALGQIVQGINQTRTNFVNVDGLQGTFEHAGDILSVPQLSDQSPLLHLSNYVNNAWVDDPVQKENGISDEMYEWLPQQAMSLLRVSGTPQSPMRYVIYCYGQALKPAPNGINTASITLANGQSAFGMVTNYQVVAESATRAVVNFGSVVTNVIVTNAFDNWISVPVVTNNQAQIEQFNVLQPY